MNGSINPTVLVFIFLPDFNTYLEYIILFYVKVKKGIYQSYMAYNIQVSEVTQLNRFQLLDELDDRSMDGDGVTSVVYKECSQWSRYIVLPPLVSSHV